MKQILNTLTLIFMFTAFVACSNESEDVKSDQLEVMTRNIAGNWKLQSLNGEALSENVYFYITLGRADSDFTIYDNIESGVSHKDTGVYALSQRDGQWFILGMYDNSFGALWNNEYSITSLTKTEMIWTTVGESIDEVQVFVKVDEIPEDIINGTRSAL